MKHLPILLAAALFSGANARDQITVNVPGFEIEEIHSGNGMTAVDFDSEGNMFVCEKRGCVLRFPADRMGGFGEPEVFADIQSGVYSEGESGLLGIALAPDFAKNGFVYLFHTGEEDQRLIRITAAGDGKHMEPGSEMILLKGLPREATNHKAGDIRFHPKDPKAIYVMLGDDTRRDLAASPDHYQGKLLRLDAANGNGLPDNPFYDGAADSLKSRIWASGFRNPFRFAFMPGAAPNHLYVSENGDGIDRLACVKRGADGGWGVHGDKGLTDPPDKNTRVLFTSKPCLTAIAIAGEGAFSSNGPVIYAANWFSGEIHRWRLNPAEGAKLTEVPEDDGKPFLTGLKAVNAAFGPDGGLYLTQTYYSESEGRDHRLVRVRAAK